MKKYNLLVPLAGRVERFVDEGYVVHYDINYLLLDTTILMRLFQVFL